MWNLDDETKYVKIHSFNFPNVFTYGDTRDGHADKDKREYIREKAAENFPDEDKICGFTSWAFRIFVKKSGNRRFDIENVPKLIVDAFSKSQIEKDNSQYPKIWLFSDDIINFVRIIEVGGI